MRKTLIALALTGLFTGAVATPARAGPKGPTTPCEIQEFLGFENVKECEDAAS